MSNLDTLGAEGARGGKEVRRHRLLGFAIITVVLL